jgi:hypothetical protein
MKKIKLLITGVLFIGVSAQALFDFGEDEKPNVQILKKEVAQVEEVDDECKAPKWAIAIGHEQLWKKHNGCLVVKDKQKNIIKSEEK